MKISSQTERRQTPSEKDIEKARMQWRCAKTETGAQLPYYSKIVTRNVSFARSVAAAPCATDSQKSRPKNHKPPHLNCTALSRSGSIRCSHQNASAISGIRHPVRGETSDSAPLVATSSLFYPSTLPSAKRKSPARTPGFIESQIFREQSLKAARRRRTPGARRPPTPRASRLPILHRPRARRRL